MLSNVLIVMKFVSVIIDGFRKTKLLIEVNMSLTEISKKVKRSRDVVKRFFESFMKNE